MGIYKVLKTHIASGQYVLADIVAKIDALWAEDKLTDDQRAELTALAQTSVDANYNPMTLREQEFDGRLLAIEGALLDIGDLIGQLMGGAQ